MPRVHAAKKEGDASDSYAAGGGGEGKKVELAISARFACPVSGERKPYYTLLRGGKCQERRLRHLLQTKKKR